MWATAIVMGLAGSLHCAGMCSPLAMAVSNLTPSVLLNRLLYNTGRIITYGLLGAIVASAGMVLPFSNLQNVVSIVMGLVLLGMGISGITGIHIPFLTAIAHRFSSTLKNIFSRFIQHKSKPSIFFLGMLNGLLPCGLTFLALTICITLTTPTGGFFFMLLFGLGTFPVMLGFSMIVPVITKKMNISVKRLTTGLLIISGILLVARVFLVHISEEAVPHQGVVDIVLCR